MKRPMAIASTLAPIALIVLSACERETPESVCASEDTIDMVRSLTIDLFVDGDPDIDLARWGDAFDEFVSFEIIILQSYDEQTKRIGCRAQISTPIPLRSALSIDYHRQPEAGTGEHVYGVSLGSEDNQAWNALLTRIDQRYEQLTRFPTTPPATPSNDVSSAAAPASTASGSGYDAGSFSVSYRGPSATITGVVGADTEAAMMTGAVTVGDAHHECALNNYQVDIEFDRCVQRVMAEYRQEFVVSANCRTGNLLALDGTPFVRTVRDGEPRWRNESSGELVSEDAMAEEAATLHAQFNSMCPNAGGGQ